MPRQLGVNEVLRLKTQIQADPDLIRYVGTVLEGEEFTQFAEHIFQSLPSDIPFDAVYQSLTGLSGAVLQPAALDAAVWRILGNLKVLRKHQPIHAWNGQREEEVVPLQVLEVEPTVTRRGDPAGRFVLQVLSGTPCPLRIEKLWTRKFCAFLGRRLGFTSTRHCYPFRDVAEFLNLRFSGIVTPDLSRQGPMFEEISVTQAQIAWNRRYLAMRARTSPRFQCPGGFLQSHHCFLCPWGLDACPAATRERTLVERDCEGCGDLGYFDPAHPERKLCVNCYQKLLYRRRMHGE